MLALSWNIRGLGRPEKRSCVRKLVALHKPSILFLQETKLSCYDSKIYNSIGGAWLNRGLGVEADRAVGGLLTLWNDELFLAKACIKNSRCIVIAGELVKLAKEVAFCNVHTHNSENERVELWDFIVWAQPSFSMPWCMGGDFNTVLCDTERKGGASNSASMRNFRSFLLQAKVVDIPIHGCAFTWTNNRELASWARLDRFLISPWILSWFPKLMQKGLPKSVSDHNAITIGEPKKDWGPCPFRLYDNWMEDSNLTSCVREGWKKHKPKGSFGFILSSKIRISKEIIKRAVKDSNKEIEKKASTDGWSESMRKERVNVLSDLWKGIRKEEQSWRKKLRVKWLKEDDTIIFLKPRLDYLCNARRILRCFEIAAGLRINFHKSCLVKVGKSGATNTNWAKVFKCKEATFPITYLGLPLGARPSSKAFWNPILNRIQKRLAPWKRNFLNKGGRLVLIKAVLASIPSYYMSVFKVPIGVANDIEKIQRSFFWGDGVAKRKLHAVNWN
ncbi:hypothetical protein Dsin_009205 [Dipteronia sinensis]|uniref:Endonuclease/exonuclease/phosphatase domain-containing protein n=1 Tax=Dipteronia sinensis TaxID=43782 RepID=A0AAE0AR56_9ROSI|nr:hypothetical protein Dsin_009205 [Dipteronia sinensis]